MILYHIETERYHWSDRAACRDKPDETWFFERRKDLPLMMEALVICQDCPVKKECLEDVNGYDDRWYAVRGGLLPRAMLDSLNVEARDMMVAEMNEEREQREAAIKAARSSNRNMLSRGYCKLKGHTIASLDDVYVTKEGRLQCKKCTSDRHFANHVPKEPRTHCRNGHERKPENRNAAGRCRPCDVERKRNGRKAKRLGPDGEAAKMVA